MALRAAKRTWSGAVAAAALLTLLLYLMFARHPAAALERLRPSRWPAAEDGIPNQVHVVYVLREPTADVALEFGQALCVFAARHYWHPRRIYLHTDAGPEAVARARDGRAGKWSRLVLNLPEVRVRRVTAPTEANGVEIKQVEHRSDFVRVQVVRELGGVYLDLDAHPLRDIRPLRRAGFGAVGGRQHGGQVNSGIFMARRGARFVSLWHDAMFRVFDGGWTTHSNDLATRFGQQLVTEPGEMLILDQAALAPGSWLEPDCVDLYEAHDGGDDDDAPSWSHNYSDTYILHAFSPARGGYRINGFDHITPRYVLERRSNFARAVFPVAKLMLDRGLIDIDDSHLGS
ncbi:hypothetical protein CDD83_10686 [Cordyceps sp. RAO-2017]|nr:hypothetical protein CDD83_10686 [Cordyceps sp. RAO-2017]